MSKFSIWLVETINRFTPPPENLHRIHQAKLSLEAYQELEFDEAQRLCPEFGPTWSVKNKKVLDVGCGLGGSPSFYASAGAKSVTALDLRPISVRATQAKARQQSQDQIHPVLADAAWMPFEDNYFDMIVSINVYEHIDDLPKALSECKRVLHPGGLIYLHIPPFYSPWGAHVEGWINFPWPHVFFSDKTLIEVARRVEVRSRKNDEYIPTAQVDWSGLKMLPELNRVTVNQFMRLVQSTKLKIVEYHLLPFGRHFLPKHGPTGRLLLFWLKLLTKLPLLNEVITTKMVFVLAKE